MRAPFVELGLVTCFSFLRGASDPVDLVLTAHRLGYDAMGVADANSMAGVVRVHGEAKALGLRPVIGCRPSGDWRTLSVSAGLRSATP